VHNNIKDINAEVCEHKDDPGYCFMSEGVVELSYTYFKEDNLNHPYIETCKTWCSAVTDMFIGRCVKDLKDNPDSSLMERYEKRVSLFFGIDPVITEVPSPKEVTTYLATISIDSNLMCIPGENQGEWESYTEVKDYLGLYNKKDGFILFNESRVHFDLDMVEHFKLYKISLGG
jgi:hypothetical protein